MNAEIVSIGTELLLGQIVDTNAAELAGMLAELGIGCQQRQTVGDNLPRAIGSLRQALGRADVVFTIGGLGPTQDDLTRDAIAGALDEGLVEDADIRDGLVQFFADRGAKWVESQARQARRPESGVAIANPNGTAPGLVCRKAGKTVIAMPGPRGEFVPMMRGPVREILRELGGGQVIHSQTMRVAGIGEAAVEERIQDLMQGDNPSVAPYAKVAEVHLRVTARAADVTAAEAIIAPMVAEIMRRLEGAVYGLDDTTLEAAIVAELAHRGLTLATAESCTGGGLAARITGVPGASLVYPGGIVAYANEIKAEWLGVPEGLLAQYGAVSEECAAAMATGARSRFGVDYGVSITGIAGPDGGTEEKPVGLVYVAVADEDGVVTVQHQFRGLREDIRTRAKQFALVLLRRRLIQL